MNLKIKNSLFFRYNVHIPSSCLSLSIFLIFSLTHRHAFLRAQRNQWRKRKLRSSAFSSSMAAKPYEEVTLSFFAHFRFLIELFVVEIRKLSEDLVLRSCFFTRIWSFYSFRLDIKFMRFNSFLTQLWLDFLKEYVIRFEWKSLFFF